MGIMTNGRRCNRHDTGFIHLTAHHLQYCQIHWGVYERRVAIRRQLTIVVAEQHHVAGRCHNWIGNINWCHRQCDANAIRCPMHQRAIDRRNQRIEFEHQRDERIQDMLAAMHALNMNWRQAIDHLFETNNVQHPTIRDAFAVARRMFMVPVVVEAGFDHEWQFVAYWNWTVDGRVGPEPNLFAPPPQVPPILARGGNLQAIARDAQNVHTRVIAEQTNKGLEKLLDASKDAKPMRSPDWFASKWLPRTYGRWDRVVRVVNDMQQWYNRGHCKEENDWLYRKTLDGLYMTLRGIRDSDLHNELYKRVFEECEESIAMCCEGHISRLCNVLVGFDDAFAPPVPFGEIIQNKMAAIYAMEVETEEKVKQATAFFNEFAVPEAERTAWLEAF